MIRAVTCFPQRMSGAVATNVAALAFVRWVSLYQARDKIEPAALAATGPQRYLVTLVDRDGANARAVAARIGPPARITSDRFLEARLEGGQLRAVANLDAVLAVDRWFAPESDMDKARIQSGANFVETAGA
jgi:hypothetical protein